MTAYGRTTKAYPTQLFYPWRLGGYPRSYVAQGKHANYATQSECNAGGLFGTDTCESVNTWALVEAGVLLNIGSRGTPWVDCVTSRNPGYEHYGSSRLECYWTTEDFRGWVPMTIGGGDSEESYTDILGNRGF